MWMAAIDFKKAFDSMQREAIWRSLRNHRSANEHLLLEKLYTDQRATVLTDVEQSPHQLSSPFSNGERHWNLECKVLGHQTESRKMRLHLNPTFF